jgi:hypothetical protein
MAIKYEVRKIVQRDLDKNKRTVLATIEKTMVLAGHLKPVVKIFDVSYVVHDEQHMFCLVDTLPPSKSLDHWERTEIAAVLRLFN